MNDDDEAQQAEEEQNAPAVSGRGAHFGNGMTEAPGSLDSPGLQQLAQRYKAQSQAGTRVQPTASGNAMSKN